MGECDTTVDDVLNSKKKPESQFSKARRLIETALAKGPVLSADMMQMAEEEGISFKTFKRAKDELGVISYQRGRQWYWELPIDVEYRECPSEGQEGQRPNLVLLSNVSSINPDNSRICQGDRSVGQRRGTG
jgi:hypothetical protein